jgi:hypothetical protein
VLDHLEEARITCVEGSHSSTVMAGLVPAIPLRLALCLPYRDRRVKPGDDNV